MLSGLHPIFGSFLTGSILPKQGVLVHVIASRLRTIIDLVFLPAFFALSGINTNIGSLSDSIDWCYAILVIATALAGKIIGAMLCARACSISWRESLTIGILMSCKGIVELIALVWSSSAIQVRSNWSSRISDYKLISYLRRHFHFSLSWRWSWLHRPSLSLHGSTRKINVTIYPYTTHGRQIVSQQHSQGNHVKTRQHAERSHVKYIHNIERCWALKPRFDHQVKHECESPQSPFTSGARQIIRQLNIHISCF